MTLRDRYLSMAQERDRVRESVKEKNDKLIAYWESIPWWQFWKYPSFEEKRRIILDNYKVLDELYETPNSKTNP